MASVAAMLAKARRPLLMIGRVSSDPGDFDRRVQLAERLDARVLTDLKTGASFPTQHPLHPYPPGLYVSGDAGVLIREADVILSLDWIDLAGSLRQACGGELPMAKIIQCSVDQYVAQRLEHGLSGVAGDGCVDPEPAGPDGVVAARRRRRACAAADRNHGVHVCASCQRRHGRRIACGAHFHRRTGAHDRRRRSKLHRPSYIRLPLGWPGEYCRFEHPLDYIGFDGGGGIGSGPGMAVGAALALQGQGGGRLPVAILGDGDYLMGLTALWTGVHYRVPLLVIVANNQSFFNDELHQERVARTRGRPVENRWIGLRMGGPRMNLATLADGQGADRPRAGAYRRRSEAGDRQRA